MNKKKVQLKHATVTEIEIIEQRLSKFGVIQKPRARLIFTVLPPALILLLIVDWLMGVGSFSRDIFRLSSTLTVAAILFISNLLFTKLPDTLQSMWLRDLIEMKSTATDPYSFSKYIDQFQQSLNGKWAWTMELFFAVGGFFSTYPVRYFFLFGGKFPFDASRMFLFYFGPHASIIAPILGYVLGFIVWRVSMIAYYIGKLGSHFTLKVQANHPDNCGGFKPLGDLVLLIAILILIPSVLLSVWASTDNVLWGGFFRFLLVSLGTLSLFVFIQPLYSIHLHMEAEARKIRAQLDILTQKIETLSFELRTQAYTITPEDGEHKMQTIEFLKKIYQTNSRIPTWPFDWKTVLGFTGAQILPILSFLITSGGTMLNLVKSLFP